MKQKLRGWWEKFKVMDEYYPVKSLNFFPSGNCPSLFLSLLEDLPSLFHHKIEPKYFCLGSSISAGLMARQSTHSCAVGGAASKNIGREGSLFRR